MNRAAIQARRDALAAQMEQGKQQYDALEAALKQLDRSLCAMAGGLQELDALLALPDDPALQEARESAAAWEEVARNYQDAPCADSPAS